MKIIRALYWEIRRLYHFFIGLRRLKNSDTENGEYPRVINLNANDVCNSHCTMCNIWQKKESHISPENFESILSDPLYKNVEFVGVTGGEPTLRTDLVAIFDALISTLPRLKGLSIITNGINTVQVKKRLNEVISLCDTKSMPFSIMFSLDGVGVVHDQQRGTDGNFASVHSLVQYYKSNYPKIHLSFGATITKDNVGYVDDLFEYAKQQGVYIRFRIAEFIKRLYNEDNTNVIRTFSDEEIYGLSLFFKKLEINYEQNQEVKFTYQNIVQMLNGGKRIVGCPYQKQGVVLNSKGGIAYCAPKSPELGNGLEKSSSVIFFENLETRKQIRKNNCDDCIHDYHSPLSKEEKVSRYKKNFLKSSFLNINTYKRVKWVLPFLKKPLFTNKNKVLIVGWYGTETVGDKAILLGIIKSLRSELGDFDLTVASINPFLTKQTLFELGVSGRVIGTDDIELIRFAKFCDKVIMGGGPLMGLNELYIPLVSFYVAHYCRKTAIVHGCGIGPFKLDSHKKAVGQILKYASRILLRDSDSVKYAKEEFNCSGELSGDPAQIVLREIATERNKNGRTSKKVMACFLREWTWEYDQNSSSEFEFREKRKHFELGLAKKIKDLYSLSGCEEIKFYHMHNFVIGNDDREFSKRFVTTHFNEWNNVSIQEELSTVENIAAAMCQSTLNVCMRFHSVLFAETLKTDFKAIDYTQGGKIEAYLKDKGKLQHIIRTEELIRYGYN